MRNRIIAKFIIPTVSVIALMTVAMVIGISISMRNDIRSRANAQIASRIDHVEEALNITNTIMLERVHSSMQLLMREGLATGAPSLAGEMSTAGSETVPSLMLGSSAQTGNFSVVDKVKAVMGGTATLFVRRGNDFVRVSTNVMKEDGSRAIGTLLDVKGKAIVAIREGRAFYGQVDILGKPYLTGYEPMYDKGKNIVGVWYVGYPVATLAQLGESISRTKILENGFVALVDTTGKVRFRSNSATDETVASVLQSDSEAEKKGWEVIRKKYEPWDFTVLAAYPAKDVSRAVLMSVLAVVLTGTLIMAALISILYFLVHRTILAPIRHTMGVAHNMAEGDLSNEIAVTAQDETGQLLSAMKEMQEKLRWILSQTRESSRQVSSASDQIADVSQNFSQRITEQAASVEETSATMEQMSATIRQTAENARDASRLAQQTKQTAEAGITVMGDTIRSMDDISRASKKIGHISDVIEEIAFQTNLLALNAAVEAARAGEHGRGFAVVAGEIRSLAQRAAQSAKEITDLIADSSEKTSAGVEIAREMSRRLEEIVDAVKKSAELMEEVAATAAEQSSGVNQVNAAMSQIEQTTQQNAALIEEAASSAEELAAQAKELMSLISFFRVGEEAPAGTPDAKQKGPAARPAARPWRPGAEPRMSTANAGRMEVLVEDRSNGGFEEF